MQAPRLLVLACAATFCASAWAQNPFEAFKGKIKAGMYEYKMEMDMGQVPGMPPGMGKQSMSFQKCVTQEDIEKGQMGRSGRDGKMPENCTISNFKMSGNTASYTMECKAPNEMRADSTITFKGDGFAMDMKMAMNQRGQQMNMNQHMESRYLGPCK